MPLVYPSSPTRPETSQQCDDLINQIPRYQRRRHAHRHHAARTSDSEPPHRGPPQRFRPTPRNQPSTQNHADDRCGHRNPQSGRQRIRIKTDFLNPYEPTGSHRHHHRCANALRENRDLIPRLLNGKQLKHKAQQHTDSSPHRPPRQPMLLREQQHQTKRNQHRRKHHDAHRRAAHRVLATRPQDTHRQQGHRRRQQPGMRIQLRLPRARPRAQQNRGRHHGPRQPGQNQQQRITHPSIMPHDASPPQAGRPVCRKCASLDMNNHVQRGAARLA